MAFITGNENTNIQDPNMVVDENSFDDPKKDGGKSLLRTVYDYVASEVDEFGDTIDKNLKAGINHTAEATAWRNRYSIQNRLGLDTDDKVVPPKVAKEVYGLDVKENISIKHAEFEARAREEYIKGQAEATENFGWDQPIDTLFGFGAQMFATMLSPTAWVEDAIFVKTLGAAGAFLGPLGAGVGAAAGKVVGRFVNTFRKVRAGRLAFEGIKQTAKQADKAVKRYMDTPAVIRNLERASKIWEVGAPLGRAGVVNSLEELAIHHANHKMGIESDLKTDLAFAMVAPAVFKGAIKGVQVAGAPVGRLVKSSKLYRDAGHVFESTLSSQYGGVKLDKKKKAELDKLRTKTDVRKDVAVMEDWSDMDIDGTRILSKANDIKSKKAKSDYENSTDFYLKGRTEDIAEQSPEVRSLVAEQMFKVRESDKSKRGMGVMIIGSKVAPDPQEAKSAQQAGMSPTEWEKFNKAQKESIDTSKRRKSLKVTDPITRKEIGTELELNWDSGKVNIEKYIGNKVKNTHRFLEKTFTPKALDPLLGRIIFEANRNIGASGGIKTESSVTKFKITELLKDFNMVTSAKGFEDRMKAFKEEYPNVNTKNPDIMDLYIDEFLQLERINGISVYNTLQKSISPETTSVIRRLNVLVGEPKKSTLPNFLKDKFKGPLSKLDKSVSPEAFLMQAVPILRSQELFRAAIQNLKTKYPNIGKDINNPDTAKKYIMLLLNTNLKQLERDVKSINTKVIQRLGYEDTESILEKVDNLVIQNRISKTKESDAIKKPSVVALEAKEVRAKQEDLDRIDVIRKMFAHKNKKKFDSRIKEIREEYSIPAEVDNNNFILELFPFFKSDEALEKRLSDFFDARPKANVNKAGVYPSRYIDEVLDITQSRKVLESKKFLDKIKVVKKDTTGAKDFKDVLQEFISRVTFNEEGIVSVRPERIDPKYYDDIVQMTDRFIRGTDRGPLTLYDGAELTNKLTAVKGTGWERAAHTFSHKDVGEVLKRVIIAMRVAGIYVPLDTALPFMKTASKFKEIYIKTVEDSVFDSKKATSPNNIDYKKPNIHTLQGLILKNANLPKDVKDIAIGITYGYVKNGNLNYKYLLKEARKVRLHNITGDNLEFSVLGNRVIVNKKTGNISFKDSNIDPRTTVGIRQMLSQTLGNSSELFFDMASPYIRVSMEQMAFKLTNIPKVTKADIRSGKIKAEDVFEPNQAKLLNDGFDPTVHTKDVQKAMDKDYINDKINEIHDLTNSFEDSMMIFHGKELKNTGIGRLMEVFSPEKLENLISEVAEAMNTANIKFDMAKLWPWMNSKVDVDSRLKEFERTREDFDMNDPKSAARAINDFFGISDAEISRYILNEKIDPETTYKRNIEIEEAKPQEKAVEESLESMKADKEIGTKVEEILDDLDETLKDYVKCRKGSNK